MAITRTHTRTVSFKVRFLPPANYYEFVHESYTKYNTYRLLRFGTNTVMHRTINYVIINYLIKLNNVLYIFYSISEGRINRGFWSNQIQVLKKWFDLMKCIIIILCINNTFHNVLNLIILIIRIVIHRILQKRWMKIVQIWICSSYCIFSCVYYIQNCSILCCSKF